MRKSEMKIIIGSDHAGFKIKALIIDFLNKEGIELFDAGTYSEESMDYPDIAHQVAAKIIDGSYHFGILICGSGNGMAMAANRHFGIRAALCWNKDIARLARQHNNANILCIPARFIDTASAINITDAFLISTFDGGRHDARINKIELP